MSERDPVPPPLEISPSHVARVGDINVRRALPQRTHRTVGAWCFADHMGPADLTEEHGLDIGPHPHCGLQTVTWLIDGQALHRDSLGSEQVIKPGQLNLMTAGLGVAHAEEATGHYRGTLQGVQLWIALPESSRFGSPAFEHHADLPRREIDRTDATVLVGHFNGLSSPARHDTELVGVDLHVYGRSTFSLQRAFEYAVIVLEGEVSINGVALEPGKLGYLAPGRDELVIDTDANARALLIGGQPFEAPILMWWNFVARTRDEIDQAYESWRQDDDRFGRVASDLARIETSAPYWRH